MPEPDPDSVSLADLRLNPVPFVQPLLWADLLKGREKPFFVPRGTWWRWTTGIGAPTMVTIKDILGRMLIDDTTAIIALGWSRIGYIPTKQEKLDTRAASRRGYNQEAVGRTTRLTIDDVLRWVQLTRSRQYNTKTRLRQEAEKIVLTPEEQAAIDQARREKNLSHVTKHRSWTRAAANLRAVGITLPLCPDGSVDRDAVARLVHNKPSALRGLAPLYLHEPEVPST